MSLRRGALVTGVATVDGEPSWRVRVVVATPGTDKPNFLGLVQQALTGEDGSFEIPKRLPPGTCATRHMGNTFDRAHG